MPGGTTAQRGSDAGGTDAAVAEHLYGPASRWLPQVDRCLHEQLRSQHASLAPLLSHGIHLSGKRLRPALLLLAAAAVDEEGVGEDHVTLATVLEMVHTATLIHDDVLDGASTRRGLATAGLRWGDHCAILLGDYLFSAAFRLAATTGWCEACCWIGEASRRVCEGEMRQVMARDLLELDEASYLEMIQGKTAELCGVACRLGSRLAGGSEQTTADLADFGQSLGIAFQIADDYLDLWGNDAVVGKTLGTDLAQGKWTLPILRLLATADASQRRQAEAILRGPSWQRFEAVLPLLHDSDARRYTRQVAQQYCQRACQALTSLPDGSAKQTLHKLARFAVERTF